MWRSGSRLPRGPGVDYYASDVEDWESAAERARLGVDYSEDMAESAVTMVEDDGAVVEDDGTVVESAMGAENLELTAARGTLGIGRQGPLWSPP